MIAILIIHFCFCVFFAWENSREIKAGIEIDHEINGAIFIYIALICGAAIGWKFSLVILLNTRVFFDVSLNLFRGLSIDYVSPNPKSKVDRFEKWLFKGNGLLPKILYLITSLILCL